MRKEKIRFIFAGAGIALGIALLVAFDDKAVQLGGVIVLFLSVLIAVLPV